MEEAIRKVLTKEAGYTDKLSLEDQVDTEEFISARIFYTLEGQRATEEVCNELGREILFYVLSQFRPDLIDSGGTESGSPKDHARDITNDPQSFEKGST